MTIFSKPIRDGQTHVFSDEAQALVAELHDKFAERIEAILSARAKRQQAFDAGKLPDFDPATANIREGDWTVAPTPPALQDRRVEITGPCDRKMIINALNSGAKVYMADLEDSHSPVFAKTIEGHVNLYDAVRGSITFDDPKSGKHYELADDIAVLMVRVRGLHMVEPGISIKGADGKACLFDFGIHMANNARELAAKGLGPFFYLPKIEHQDEAALWSDIITHCEQKLRLERGQVKVTLLIETLPAVFCMHEILHALKENIVGLNCGRWDYIFSYIKTFRKHSDRILPERNQVHMGVPFLDSYSKLLVQTCHRRGAHAMGGMSAFIPIQGDDKENEKAFQKVSEDKMREIENGHDGSWVAHPGLVKLVKDLFDSSMPGISQKDVFPEATIGRDDLIARPDGTVSLGGIDNNIEVALAYTTAWLGGSGAVPVNNLMEDLATAEISRSQLWQWLQSKATLDDGSELTAEFIDARMEQAMSKLREKVEGGVAERLELASRLIGGLVRDKDLQPFMSTVAQRHLA